MTTFQVIVCHYPFDPQRRQWQYEQEQLLQPLRVTVQADTYGQGRLRNYRECWRLASESTADYVLILNDDMWPCPNFGGHLQAMLDHRPEDDAIISPFNMRHKVTAEAQRRGARWIKTPNCAYGAATMMPPHRWATIAAWEREHVLDGEGRKRQSDDVRVNLWARHTGTAVWLTNPSFLQHVGHSASVAGHGGRQRIATNLHTGEPLDWTNQSIYRAPACRHVASWLKPKE